jgi:glutamate racemase
VHLVITDSGLGGLGICAAIESAFRLSGSAGNVRLTYFNAWPEKGRGYNSLPDEATRLAFFDRALARMSQLGPDRIVIACNTLSVLFGLTRFARTSALPVVGIIDAGVDLFHEALGGDRSGSIALFGTRITMESGVHRDRLVQRGIAPDRIVSVPCHGLAAAIEKDAGSSEVERLIDQSASQAAALMPRTGPLLAGLCCTHYGYVADRFRASLERASGRAVRILDPNGALVRLVVPEPAAGFRREAPPHAAEDPSLAPRGSSLPARGVITAGFRREAPPHAAEDPSLAPRGSSLPARGVITVEVLSKVTLDESTRAGIGRLVAPVSSATARALQSYSHVPDLF